MGGSFYGLVSMVQNLLGVPMGATIIKSGASGNNSGGAPDLTNDDFVQSIVSITVDDIIIGDEPFFYTAVSSLDADETIIMERVRKEFDSIARWVARDLLVTGFSVYTLSVKDGFPYLYPVLGELSFVLNSKKQILCYKDGKKITDAVVYINYNKQSLKETDKKYVYDVTPVPVQLANVKEALLEMKLAERALLRYRKDASRVIQYATVDVGMSQGDKLQDAIDKVAAPLNANSISLEGTTTQLFDDELAVIPTRREIGKPDVQQFVPSADISSLVDVDHIMSKVFLGLHFPKSYADFTQPMNDTAVSLVRGDKRYASLIKSTVSLINTQTNQAIQSIDFVRRHKVCMKLTQVPTPEDDEVIQAVQSYSDLIEAVYGFIVGDEPEQDQVMAKIDMFEALLGDAVNLKSINQFIQLLRKYAKEHVLAPASEEGEQAPQISENEEIDIDEEGFANPEDLI